MNVLFYFNRNVLSWLIRICSCQWLAGQRPQDVPSHMAIGIGRTVYEFLWGRGWNKRGWQPVDDRALQFAYPLTPAQRVKVWEFEEGCRGDRYDAAALACSLIDEGLPADYQLTDRNTRAYDCSRNGLAACVKAEVASPHQAAALGGSPSPNAVQGLLRLLARHAAQ